jgi:hypothetical protein
MSFSILSNGVHADCQDYEYYLLRLSAKICVLNNLNQISNFTLW